MTEMTPGRAAYEAYVADMTARSADVTGTAPFAQWDDLADELRNAMEASAKAAMMHISPELRAVIAERDRLQGELDRLLDEATGTAVDDLRITGRVAAERDKLRVLVAGMLQSFPDTSGEQEWRDRAGELGVTDPDGEPYRAYTEEDL